MLLDLWGGDRAGVGRARAVVVLAIVRREYRAGLGHRSGEETHHVAAHRLSGDALVLHSGAHVAQVRVEPAH